jgi:hypothetical protein
MAVLEKLLNSPRKFAAAYGTAVYIIAVIKRAATGPVCVKSINYI